MSNLQGGKDEQAIRAVQRFCAKPYADHGNLGKDGFYPHDWARLVQEVFRIYYDQALDDEPAKLIGNEIREKYPNKRGWNERVSSSKVQKDILQIIKNRSTTHWKALLGPSIDEISEI